jgi:hypothetical protein
VKSSIKWRPVAAVGVAAFVVIALAFASGRALAGSGAANPNGNGYAIANNTPGFIKHATDTGAADPSQIMALTVRLKPHNTSQLDHLVQQRRAKGNGNSHKWIDQATFNVTCAPSAQEVNSFTNFAHGPCSTCRTTTRM